MSTGSALWRLSANRLDFTGGIRPVCINEALPVEPEPGHLFTQRAARNIEPVHHAADLAAGFRERTLDQRALELINLLGERELYLLDLRPYRESAETECIAFRSVAQFAHVAGPVLGHQHVHRRSRHWTQLPAMCLRGRRREIREQERDVLLARAQRRHHQLNN